MPAPRSFASLLTLSLCLTGIAAPACADAPDKGPLPTAGDAPEHHADSPPVAALVLTAPTDPHGNDDVVDLVVDDDDDHVLAPLSEPARAAFVAGAQDDPIPVDVSYIQSNETRHDLFFGALKDLGGVYIGIGSDQNFTMAAAARAEAMVLMDIDQRVVDLHQIYTVLIPRADTPDDLVSFFAAEHEGDTKALLADHLPDEGKTRILTVFRVGRETVHRHLQRVRARTVDGQAASWLSDPAMFAHVRALQAGGRVRALPGDLTGAASMKTAARAANALDLPVTVIYLSNAEEFFRYTTGFRDNINTLPASENAVALRTIYNKTWEHADLWAYQVQPLADFRARLADRPRNFTRKVMFNWAKQEGAVHPDAKLAGLTHLERR